MLFLTILLVVVVNTSCPPGTDGEFCHLSLSDYSCKNGVPSYTTLPGELKVVGVECQCPISRVGHECQFSCSSTESFSSCFGREDLEIVGKFPLLQRSVGSTWGVSGTQYLIGLAPHWYGLAKMHELTASNTEDVFVLDVFVNSVHLRCFDFRVSAAPFYYVQYDSCETVFWDDATALSKAYEILPVKFAPFSENSQYVSCPGDWWYSGGFGTPACTETPTDAGWAYDVKFFVTQYRQYSTCTPLVVRKFDNIEFNRPFEDYRKGFGNCVTEDCFRGLDYIDFITRKSMFDLKLDIAATFDGVPGSASARFSLGDDFKLHMRDIRGSKQIPADTLIFHNHNNFTSCPSRGGWWWYDGECSFAGINPSGRLRGPDPLTAVSVVGAVSENCTDCTVSSLEVNVCGGVVHTDVRTAQKDLFFATCRNVLVRPPKAQGIATSLPLFKWKYLEDYKSGFGNCSLGECWMGLEELHELTEYSKKKLIIQARFADGEFHSLECNDFHVSDESSGYVASLGKCTGSYLLWEQFTGMNGQKFTTTDAKNSACADVNKGNGWWYVPNEPECFSPTVESISASFESFNISVCGLSLEDIEEKEDNFQCTPFMERSLPYSSTNFERDYDAYINGFPGWMGLRALRDITERAPVYLDVDMYSDDVSFSFQCGVFLVGDEASGFEIFVDQCGGDEIVKIINGKASVENVAAAFNVNGAKFYTRDHVEGPLEAPLSKSGGFWYPLNDYLSFAPSDANGAFYDFLQPENVLQGIRLSVCQVIKPLDSPLAFEKPGDADIPARLCRENCEAFVGRTIEIVERGAQVYMFSEINFRGKYHAVCTGPKILADVCVIPAGTKSFYTSYPQRPIIFELEDYEYSKTTQMMALVDSCSRKDDCGWEGNIGSIFVPPNYRVLFFNQPVGFFDDDNDMYSIGGGDKEGYVDPRIVMPIESWILEYSNEMGSLQYPVLFEKPNYGGKMQRLRYDCVSDCLPDSFSGFKSLYVPDGYVVTLYESEDHEGIKARFVGKTSIPRLDGWFSKNNPKSYKSDITKIERIERVILRYLVDQAKPRAPVDKELSQLVVNNPTASVKTMEFVDTFEKTLTINTNKIVSSSATSELNQQGAQISTSSHWGLESEDTWSIGVGASARAVVSVQGQGMGAEYEFDKSWDIDNIAEESGDRDTAQFRLKTTAVSQEMTEGSVNEESEVKEFNYQCMAMPFTITTCVAIQKQQIFDIPFYGEQTIYFTDGNVIKMDFNGTLPGTAVSSVFFRADEMNIGGYCNFGYDDWAGDCYKPLYVTTIEQASLLAAGSVPKSAIEYNQLDFLKTIDFCYQEQGAQLASLHSDLQSYYVVNTCGTHRPVMIGTWFDSNARKHKNVDGSEFDYHRFPFGYDYVNSPTEDSYVVVDDDGVWQHVPFGQLVTTCGVCKKDVNQQAMIPFEVNPITWDG